MSSYNRRTVLTHGLLIAGSSLLAGCFRPMLAEGGNQRSLRGRIAMPTIEGRFGYFLSKSLEDRLGETEQADWILKVSTNITRRGLAVAQNNSVTRQTLLARANWVLRRASTGAVVLSDTATSQSGFNATTSLFATRQTEQDVERRLARDIGERIARRIYAKAEALGS